MNYYICSISFRHELVSFKDLIEFAHRTGYHGIELWGVHGKAMLQNNKRELANFMDIMQFKNLNVSMISDYIDLCAPDDHNAMMIQKWNELIAMASVFRTNKIRVFATNQSSSSASQQEWDRCVRRLRKLSEIASERGVYLVIETHPNTYADTLVSTLRLLHDVGHSHVRINLDFLHLWESGSDPIEVYHSLKPWTVNYHMKNVSSLDKVELFAPTNVFSPSGNRIGMTALSEGSIDYATIVQVMEEDRNTHPVAMEWFGEEPHVQLKAELAWLTSLNNKRKQDLQFLK